MRGVVAGGKMQGVAEGCRNQSRPLPTDEEYCFTGAKHSRNASGI